MIDSDSDSDRYQHIAEIMIDEALSGICCDYIP